MPHRCHPNPAVTCACHCDQRGGKRCLADPRAETPHLWQRDVFGQTQASREHECLPHGGSLRVHIVLLHICKTFNRDRRRMAALQAATSAAAGCTAGRDGATPGRPVRPMPRMHPTLGLYHVVG